LLSILNRKKFRDIDLKELAYCYRVYELVDQPVYREQLDTFHALVFDKFADEDEWEEIVTRNKDIWLEVIIEKSNAAQTRKFRWRGARRPLPEGCGPAGRCGSAGGAILVEVKLGFLLGSLMYMNDSHHSWLLPLASSGRHKRCGFFFWGRANATYDEPECECDSPLKLSQGCRILDKHRKPHHHHPLRPRSRLCLLLLPQVTNSPRLVARSIRSRAVNFFGFLAAPLLNADGLSLALHP
jgi:hypothetical protein